MNMIVKTSMKHIFKLTTLFALLFIVPVINVQANPFLENFDKNAFYAAMAGENVEELNTILTRLKETTIPEKAAYEGALLMKKAGLVKKPKDKLSLFKLGHIKLEAIIKADEDNIEYRFLRLMIQENAPKIVKYKSDLKNDTALIIKSFRKLPPVVQQAIKDYSKNSKFLKPSDF